MLAVSGGARYGILSRGPGYFARQWKSHHPERPNYSRKTLGTLIYVCKKLGMMHQDTVSWEEDFQRQLKESESTRHEVPQDIVDEIRRFTNGQ